MHANIIGAGIAGPMAAITLRRHGYEVDVWEQRALQDLRSDGVLGITPESWSLLQEVGTDAPSRSLSESGHDLDGLVWTDLHQSLAKRAEELGARFHFGKSFTSKTTDLTVWATGVGSAKQVTDSHYTGYTIIRGLAYQLSGETWTEIDGREPDGTNWYLMAADIATGTSVAWFVPRENPTFRTTYSVEDPHEIKDLPTRWTRMLETVPQWQIVPMSDWDVPSKMIHAQPGSTPIVRIGDANGQLRPMTAMGANLALAEASDVDLLIERSRSAEQHHLSLRQWHHDEGIRTGIRV